MYLFTQKSVILHAFCIMYRARFSTTNGIKWDIRRDNWILDENDETRELTFWDV